jgi:L-asparaginase
MQKRHKIAVLTTGGTIEKSYDEEEGSLEVAEALIKKYALEKLRLPYTDLQVIPLMGKDSLFMTDQDRELILKMVTSKTEEGLPVIVIHGTDTMTLTAEYCLKHWPHPKTPVVFTGAMKPIGFIDSDGLQNVAEAILACKLTKPGYYVSFHSEVYSVPQAIKIKESRTFGLKN